ncbi:MAG: YdcF family protein, partial [Chloroflexi bacterium]
MNAQPHGTIAGYPEIIVVLGGGVLPDGKPPRTEAATMADVIVAAGIGGERIFLEDESRDTIGNAIYVAERYLGALAPRPVYVVTSPFHLQRS